MVTKANGKSTARLFGKHITRLITIMAIVAVSVGFMSGLAEVENKIKKAANRFYIESNVSDFYIKSTKPTGFSAEEISYISEKFGEKNVLKSFSYELDSAGKTVRVYSHGLDADINKLELIEGRKPASANEILAERETTAMDGYEIGDIVEINGRSFTVCGTVINPMHIIKIEEQSFTEVVPLGGVLYVENPHMVNDVYVTLDGRDDYTLFGRRYEKRINGIKAELDAALGDGANVLTLYENYGMFSLVDYAEKVGLISIVFVVFFLLVTMLVVYSAMTRLFDEERGQIACLKTLGYSDGAIIGRYVWFVTLGTVVGGIIAFGIGVGLTSILYSAFGIQYAMPPFPKAVHYTYYVLTFAIITLSTLLLTYFTGRKIVSAKPAELLTPKAPKKGKKVFLERIGFIWNRLSFKYKSSFRNVLLFKSRFFMTVISIIGSSVLVLAGMGLLDCSVKLAGGESLKTISAALIIFSAVLCALVIYNITNINVSERNREIATLMVLGYSDKEVTGYIFREIYIMCAIGAVLGVPLGVGFLQFVFGLIDFGALVDINWWTWILAPAVTMLFAFVATTLLYAKVIKTDMNASLKTRE